VRASKIDQRVESEWSRALFGFSLDELICIMNNLKDELQFVFKEGIEYFTLSNI